MKQFFRSLLPNQIPGWLDSSDPMLVLRERNLQIVLLTLTAAGSALFVFMLTQASRRNPLSILLVGITLLVLIVLALLRQYSFNVRSYIAIGILFVLSTATLFIYGVEGSGIVMGLSFSVLAFLIRGPVVGFTYTLFNMMSISLTGFLMVSGRVLPPSSDYLFSSTMPAGWVVSGLVYVVMALVVLAAALTMVRGLLQSTQAQMDLSKELAAERDSLEIRIQQRTQEVEKRANQLETATSIAREILQESNLDRLLVNSVELIRERFGLYYAALFLVDDEGEYAVLRAGTGEAGREMLQRNHRLKVGQVGMVGYVVSNNEFRLAQDVKSDPSHYDNPFLPATESELALPLNLEGKVIGAIDVQSTQKDYFNPDDIKALQLTADQIAVAIQRARLITQLEKSLKDMEKGLRQFTQQSWRSYLKSSTQSYAYRYNRSAFEQDVAPSPEATVVMRTNAVQIKNAHTDNGTQQSSLALPIKLRDQLVGVLDVHFDAQRTPANLVPLLEEASNRLAIALENARLLEEVKNRAASDQVVSEISNRVRSAANIDQVLKTAAAELGRNLGLSEVVVQLIPSE